MPRLRRVCRRRKSRARTAHCVLVWIADVQPIRQTDSMMKRGGMSAGELLALQADDPIYQVVRTVRDRELAVIAEKRAEEQQPLLKDLAAIGVHVEWVGRLCTIPEPDERIYAVLLDHLKRAYSPWLLDWIGRAFGRKTARPIVWEALVDLVKAHVLHKAAVGGVIVAISDMAEPCDVPTLIELLSDRAVGPSRIFLVRNLMRSKQPVARTALLQHQEDPDLAKEISIRLARTRN